MVLFIMMLLMEYNVLIIIIQAIIFCRGMFKNRSSAIVCKWVIIIVAMWMATLLPWK